MNRPPSEGSAGGVHADVEAKVFDATDEAAHNLVRAAAVKAVGPEIAVRDAVTEEVVGGGENGGGKPRPLSWAAVGFGPRRPERPRLAGATSTRARTT